MIKKRTLLLLTLCFLFAFGLRLWHIGTQSIWFDEGFSWHAANQPTLIASIDGDPTNPPLYYLLLHIWIRLVGDSELGLRSLSLLQGMILLALMGHAARRWFSDAIALPVIAFGALTPLLWWASQEARMYNTLAIAVLLMTLGLVDILTSRHISRQAWIMLLVGEVAALYSHNTGIVVFAGLNATFGIIWLVDVIRRQSNWRQAVWWAIGQLIVVVLWLPELFTRFINVSGANAASIGSSSPLTTRLWQSWMALWAGPWDVVLAAPRILIIISAIMLAVLFYALFAFSKRQGQIIVLLVVVLFSVLLAALAVLGVNLHGRYLVMLTPLIIILCIGGFDISSELVSKNMAVKPAGLSWVLVALTAITWVAFPGQMDSNTQHDQAREMVAFYADNLQEEDVVLAWSYAERYELQYYWDRYAVGADLITLPDGASADEITRIINAQLDGTFPRRAEINVWYTQASDRRGMLPCLIGNNNPPPISEHTVVGMTSLGYQINQPIELWTVTPLDDAVSMANTLHLAGISMPQNIPANHGICVMAAFQQATTTNQSLSTAVNVQNSLGWEISSSSQLIGTDNQQSTEQLSTNDYPQSYNLLYLPVGTPPGHYPLTLRVFDEESPSGLDIIDSQGAPAGKDIALGTIALNTGTWGATPLDCTQTINADIELLTCLEDNIPDTVNAGDRLPIDLLWNASNIPHDILLSLNGTDEGWQTSSTQRLASGGLIRTWHDLVIPPKAAGSATLTVQVSEEQPVIIAELEVIQSEHTFTMPDVAHELQIPFPGIGTLVGLEDRIETIADGETITLVWKASSTAGVNYAVTVQVLDEAGRLVAQHDSIPANSMRPTTGWVTDEFIIDEHTVSFINPGETSSESGLLIVAVYDPTDGTRVLTEQGLDHAVIGSAVIHTP